MNNKSESSQNVDLPKSSDPAFEQAKANFVAARDAALAQKTAVETLTANIAEAEAQALSAKEKRKSLIKAGTTATKELQALVAEERTAYSLAEDYREVLADREEAWEDAKLEAERMANMMIRKRSELIGKLSATRLPGAIQAHDELYEAIGMHVIARQFSGVDAGVASYQARELGYDDAADRAISEVLSMIRNHFLSHRNHFLRSSLYADFTIPSGTDIFKPGNWSPARARQREILREQAKQTANN